MLSKSITDSLSYPEALGTPGGATQHEEVCVCECQCVYRPQAVGSEAQTDDGSEEDEGILSGVRGDTVCRAGSGGRCRGVFGRRADLSRPLTSLLETKRTRRTPPPPLFSLRSHTTRTHAHVMYFTETQPAPRQDSPVAL